MEGKFDKNYYDANYFAIPGGKKFNNPGGNQGEWSYANHEGEWTGCEPIVKAWKDIFKCQNLLDCGCGRGTFIAYARVIGIKAVGFDFSEWAVSHLYTHCEGSWVTCKDATKDWGYPDKSFDLVTVLDLMEHLYVEDIGKVINEMYRVAKKYVFLQIATVGGGSGSGTHNNGYILKRGDPVPVELEGMAVAGHVTVQDREFWAGKLKRDGWILRDDLVLEFIKLVPLNIISAWVKNTMIVMERV